MNRNADNIGNCSRTFTLRHKRRDPGLGWREIEDCPQDFQQDRLLLAPLGHEHGGIALPKVTTQILSRNRQHVGGGTSAIFSDKRHTNSRDANSAIAFDRPFERRLECRDAPPRTPFKHGTTLQLQKIAL